MERQLIINCDDYGMYPAINEGVLNSIEEGIASSCSVMPPCSAAEPAMELLRDRPHIPFGIHLTLFCDTPSLPWGPLTSGPSLLSPEGRLFAPSDVPALLAQARIEDVSREFRAQIRSVLDAGLTPTHLDWHCLADGGRADIFEATVALAAEHGLAVRAWLDPARKRMRGLGQRVIDHDFVDSFALDPGTKFQWYAERLRALPPGLSEWAVHPGIGDEQAQAIDPGCRVRSTDHEFLTSHEAAALLTSLDVEVIDYRELRAGR